MTIRAPPRLGASSCGIVCFNGDSGRASSIASCANRISWDGDRVKPAKDDVRDPRSATCWMCHQTKRIVKGADSEINVLTCDYCDSAGSHGPHVVR